MHRPAFLDLWSACSHAMSACTSEMILFPTRIFHCVALDLCVILAILMFLPMFLPYFSYHVKYFCII